MKHSCNPVTAQHFHSISNLHVTSCPPKLFLFTSAILASHCSSALSMAAPSLSLFSFFFFICLALSSIIHAQVEESGLKISADALEWPMAMSMYSDLDEKSEFGDGLIDLDGEEDGDEEMGVRRSLFWRRVHYYISYGALAANRIPCPPRSGRSYYTHNCFKARAPVNPYSRGCSRITRCRR
ncbi:protein RALF-like 34 [Manihot esculenta]|uniref:Uncharacterized protein n=2 Tax=Manihot esculenta TaxID=3983 RepID=A0ACB7GR05_MANES|nr:protein RALF-like 34 [Manihot esculenta]KAG8642627.1 hypothetical protein MANES_12G103411v8 [Manihot esculenta]